MRILQQEQCLRPAITLSKVMTPPLYFQNKDANRPFDHFEAGATPEVSINMKTLDITLN